jgi:hypothetical protein
LPSLSPSEQVSFENRRLTAKQIRLAAISRQGCARQILAEHMNIFNVDLLYPPSAPLRKNFLAPRKRGKCAAKHFCRKFAAAY